MLTIFRQNVIIYVISFHIKDYDMIYYIQTLNGAKYVCAREEAKILIDENLITAEKFLEIIKENEVEIKHLQNVYDDLIYSVS